MARAHIIEEESISSLVPKNHFASLGFFREKPLINWTYTKAVLFTAYDVFRSTDFWIDSVIRSGKTLKESLIELGFPKGNTLIADTGVFEIEAKKAGVAKELGIEINIELTNDQIFEAYQLSGADYFVAPDEIVLAVDNSTTKKAKIDIIKTNLLNLLEITPAASVIGVLQGVEQHYLEDLFDFYLSHGVTKFAAGGMLPLYWHDKKLFQQVVSLVRKLTEGYWLHSFGLPDVKLLPFYLMDAGMDSVDTSMLLYMTARRRYLVGIHQKPVRLASFEHCSCEGCANLSREMYTRREDFFVSLYIHNIMEASKVADACVKGEWTPHDDDIRILKDEDYKPNSSLSGRKPKKNEIGMKTSSGWSTADTHLNGN